jgi:hypothetical protein
MREEKLLLTLIAVLVGLLLAWLICDWTAWK